MTTPNRTKTLDFDAWKEAIAKAVLDWHRAMALSDEAWEEVLRLQKLHGHALDATRAAYDALQHLIRVDKK